MSEVATEKELFVYGNYHDEELVFPDLKSMGSNAEFKMGPGEVVNFEDFFTTAKLKRSRSLNMALTRGWIKPCGLDEVITITKKITASGEAPLNEFDIRLAEELEKEAKEEERLRRGSVDTLGARARKALASKEKP